MTETGDLATVPTSVIKPIPFLVIFKDLRCVCVSNYEMVKNIFKIKKLLMFIYIKLQACIQSGCDWARDSRHGVSSGFGFSC